MKEYEFTVTSGSREITILSEEPESVQEAVEKYGETVVLETFNTKKRSTEGDFIRRFLKANELTDEQIEEKFSKWTLGVSNRGKSAEEKALEQFDKLTDEQKAKVLARLGSTATATTEED